MQLVEAHLIPGATLRAADLKPGALYQTALPGAFLTVSGTLVSLSYMSQTFLRMRRDPWAWYISPVIRDSQACMWHMPG